MTKAVTGAAAMQLVEQERLNLDSPAASVIPYLGEVGVLEGFDDDGKPRTRPPRRAITLRHLLTHTTGFSYEIWSDAIVRFQEATGTPGIITCENAALTTPLLFDPGDRWDYGINLDWAGKMVEAVSGQSLGEYLRENLLGPLGMNDTAFRITDGMRARLAKIHQRGEDGALEPQMELEIPQDPEFEMGGGGLYGTVGDYLRFIRMILNRGRANGEQVLKPETVDHDVPQPDGRYSCVRAQDRDSAALARRGVLSRPAEVLGPELHDQQRGSADRTFGGELGMGGARQFVLLDRPDEGHRRRLPHPGAALH